jgi:protease II
MKSQFIYVSPKTSNAKEVFVYDMDRLHSCKIVERKDGMMKLESISGRFVFWMNENNEDKNWRMIK